MRTQLTGWSNNGEPVTRIHSGQSKGVGTSMGLKLYRNGTLLGSILSKLVLGSPRTERRHLLTWPAMPLQKTWSKSTYDYNIVSIRPTG